MRFAVIYSSKNIAGTNIVEQLRKISYLPQIPIIKEKNKQIIFLEKLDEKKYPQLEDIDFLVIASTHKSEKGNPSLCLHAPGNWRGADLGGEQGRVCIANCFVLKYLFQQLEENAKQNNEIYERYNVTLEVTHHGPLTNIPCCFIEVGSSEEQWKDVKAAEVVAKTILSLQDFNIKSKKQEWVPAIGLGGPHYAPVFSKVQLNSKYAIGHIIPQYSLPLTESMLQEAEQKTQEQVKDVIVDWKGCGKSEERAKALEIIEKLGLKYKRTSEASREDKINEIKNERVS